MLSDSERKHLILTEKNGSGKTSLLEAIRDEVKQCQLFDLRTGVKAPLPSDNSQSRPVEISYSIDGARYSDTIFSYIAAERGKLSIPSTIERMNIKSKRSISENLSNIFLRYMLSLDYQLYGAKTDGNSSLAKTLETWFDNFLQALRDIYDCPELKLIRDAKNLTFLIEKPGNEPFPIQYMSDGYKAFLDIYMELLVRFESEEGVAGYDTPAIVLVDEIETHLHVELQKRVLPFLTKMFPNVQFIVSTHSPFVITSLSSAVVYDLEKHERLENPSFYSYESGIALSLI